MAKSETIAELKRKILEIDAGSLDRRVSSSELKRSDPSESRADDADRAFKKIVALVNASDKSERALRERLQKESFDEVEIEDAIEKAKRYSLIDDMRFAEVLIRSRLNQGRGAQGIVRELRENDIEADMVPGWPFEFGIDEQSEFDRALGVLKRNPPRSKNKREGAYRKLVGKGYSSSVASSAARAWFESTL